MIEIIPAIDIIDGKCVRLEQGDYSAKKEYSASPLDLAKSYEDAGIKRLHLVDLDGAKAKHVININTLKEIKKNTNLIIDFGGGIKTDEDIQKVFYSGVDMVTIGSVAVTDPCKFDTWLNKYSADKIILGADVKGYKLAIGGWLDTTKIELFDFLAENKKLGVKNILCTDISKDGMLQGPSFDLYRSIKDLFSNFYLIASGGVSKIEDVEKLNEMKIDAVIIGKAIYEGKISLKQLEKFL